MGCVGLLLGVVDLRADVCAKNLHVIESGTYIFWFGALFKILETMETIPLEIRMKIFSFARSRSFHDRIRRFEKNSQSAISRKMIADPAEVYVENVQKD